MYTSAMSIYLVEIQMNNIEESDLSGKVNSDNFTCK